jgi:hypothetical protein
VESRFALGNGFLKIRAQRVRSVAAPLDKLARLHPLWPVPAIEFALTLSAMPSLVSQRPASRAGLISIQSL